MAKTTPEIKEKLAHDRWVSGKSNEEKINAAGWNAFKASCVRNRLILSDINRPHQRFNWI